MKSLRGSCHCGAVAFEVRNPRDFLTVCNCSICRRTRALWLHCERKDADVRYAPDAVIRYVWGDKMLSLISCKTCGCTTHWEGLGEQTGESRMAVNAALADPADVDSFRVRHFDGADTWEYLD